MRCGIFCDSHAFAQSEIGDEIRIDVVSYTIKFTLWFIGLA